MASHVFLQHEQTIDKLYIVKLYNVVGNAM